MNLNVLIFCRFSAITKWIHKWKKNGWKLVDGKDVKNKEDFEELNELQKGISVKYVSAIVYTDTKTS
jgi:ribonuclease HI